MERTRRLCFGILLALAITAGDSSAEGVEPLGRLFNFWDAAGDVVINPEYAFVACGRSGVQVVDIRDPYETGVVAVFDNLSGAAQKVELAGSRLYVQAGTGIHILGVRNMWQLWEMGFVSAGESVHDFSGAQNFLAVSSYTRDEDWLSHGKVILYKVNDPADPVAIDTLIVNSPGDLNRVLVRGTKAIVEADSTYIIYEIGENYEVERRGEIPLGYGLYGLDGRGDYIVLGYERHFEVWSIVNPAQPRRMSEVRHPAYGMRGMRLNYPYLTIWGDWNRYYQIYNVTNPADVRIIDEGGHPVLCRAVSDGDFCFVVDGFDRLYSMTSDGGLANLFQSRGFITDIELTGTRAFVALQNSGFAIVDTRNPDRSEVLTTIPLDGWTLSITTADTLIFTSGRGFRIFDGANPRIPEIGLYTAQGNLTILQAVVDGNTAFLLLGYFDNPQIDVLDISNPRSPRLIGNLETGIPDARMVYNSDEKYLYIAGSCSEWDNRDENFAVIDVSTPEHPARISGFRLAFDESYVLNDIAIDGGLLALSLENVGVILYELSDPANPNFVGDCSPAQGGYGAVGISQNHLYAAGSVDGLTVYDINIPQIPNPVGNVKDFISAVRMRVRDDGLVALSTGGSLRFYDSQGALGVGKSSPLLPNSAGLISAYPNPFNDRATIRVNMPTNAPMQLVLFDVSGRRFGESILAKNQGCFILNGNALPTGSFYIQATSGRETETLPIRHLK